MRKIWPIVLTLALFGVLAAGCGQSKTTSANEGTSGSDQAQAADNTSSGDNKTGDESKGDSSKKSETTFEKAKRTGEITIGFAGEIPYAYKDKDGKLTGEAVEVARAVFKNLGITKINGVLTDFNNLIPGLNAKRFDTITAGMFINPDRAKQVLFADPEYRIGEALAVKKGNPKNLHSYADIAANKDVKVAVMQGAIEEDYMKKSGVAKDQIVVVSDQPAAIQSLKTGRVQAITMTGPSLEAMLKSAKDDNIVRVEDFKQPVIDGKEIWGYGATAFRKEDQDFRDAFTTELNKLKSSGKLLDIVSPFGFTKAELPGDITADDIISGK